MTIIKFIYRNAWQKLRNKLHANTGERKLINAEEMNKKNRGEKKYTKNIITKNYVTQSLKYY
jgi:hypothetical protein